MMTTTKNIFRILIIALLIHAQTVFASDVYYLGGYTDADKKTETPARSYSITERVKDLLDFSGEDRPDRSGKISGNYSQEVYWQNISGNKEKSFLYQGTQYVSELHLNMQEKLVKGYDFDGQMFLRKTDNTRIDQRKDVRLKQMSLAVRGEEMDIRFGDIYGELSQFTLGSDLEGFDIDINPTGFKKYKQDYHFIFARQHEQDDAAGQFAREVFGAQLNQYLFEDISVFKSYRAGFNIATIMDDATKMDRISGTQVSGNTVISTDGDISFSQFVKMKYELARSMYIEDRSSDVKDIQYGTAFRLNPSIRYGMMFLRYMFNYIQPNFTTLLGSANPDMLQHQVSLGLELTKKIFFNIEENYHWNHLEGSSLSKRTTSDEKYISLTMKPWDAREYFTMKPYFNIQDVNSDDIENTAESTTVTTGFSIDDQIGENMSVGTNYEYRAYMNGADKSISDYFNKFGLYCGLEQMLFSRRFYIYINPAMDIRDPKNNENESVLFTNQFFGEYDIHELCTAKFGYNIQSNKDTGTETGFFNTMSYLEFDFLINKRRHMELSLRGELNDYNHQNGDDAYKEARIVTRLSCPF